MKFNALIGRLVCLGVVILGAWAFSDEMGLRKRLNRVAFISFLFSMAVFGATLMIEALFIFWSAAAAFLLWSGSVSMARRWRIKRVALLRYQLLQAGAGVFG